MQLSNEIPAQQTGLHAEFLTCEISFLFHRVIRSGVQNATEYGCSFSSSECRCSLSPQVQFRFLTCLPNEISFFISSGGNLSFISLGRSSELEINTLTISPEPSYPILYIHLYQPYRNIFHWVRSLYFH